MSRAPYVISATVVGMAALLAYHPHGSTGSVNAASAGVAVGTSTAASSTAASSSTDASGTTDTTSAAPTTDTAPTSATTTPASTTTTTKKPAARAVTTVGDLVTISDGGRQFGDIQVKITSVAGTLTHVSIAQVDVGDGRSQEIENQSIPMLLQQTAQAGSAQIDGVSGATYTSQAYEQSLQSAIDKIST